MNEKKPASMPETEEKPVPGFRERAYLGVDGGGTKTDFALCSEDGTILRRVTLAGCNPTVCGIEGTISRLYEGMDALDTGAYELRGAFFGIAGCPDEKRRSAIVSAFARRFPGVPADADADVMNVVYSTGYRGDCIAAICGTGSVAFAVKDGMLHRVGGWGPVFDKEGSGYDIGRDAVRAALAEEDGFGEKTVLTPQIRKIFNDSVFNGAASLPPADFSRIAAFAPLVFRAEKQGDAVAAEILARNFSRLAFLINKAARLYACGPRVILAGGAASDADAIKKYLTPELDDGLVLTFPGVPPVYGALAKAREIDKR